MSFKRPRAWDSSEVVRFLREADLAEFESSFVDAGITGAGLFALNDSELGRLGLARIKQRKRFYLALKSLDLHAISPPASPDKKGPTPFAEEDNNNNAPTVVVVCDSDGEAKSHSTKPRAKRAKRALKSRSPEVLKIQDEASTSSSVPLVTGTTGTGESTGSSSSSSNMEALYGPVGYSNSTPSTGENNVVKVVASEVRSPEVRSPRSRALAVRKLSNASIVNSPLHVDSDRDRAGRTALLHAAWDGRHAEVSALLARGAAVDTCAEADGKTPLMLAAENGHVDTVLVLLAGGASTVRTATSPRALGRPALSLASARGHAAVVEALLGPEGKAAAAHPDAEGRTALSLASEHGYENVVTALLAHCHHAHSRAAAAAAALAAQAAAGIGGEAGVGAQVAPLSNSFDVDSDGHFDSHLLKAILAADVHGRSPLMYACAEGHVHVVALLLDTDHRDDASSALLVGDDSTRGGNRPLGRSGKAAACLCDPNARDEAGFTALHLCAKANQQTAAIMLLGAGANLNVKDLQGRTPLHLARSISYAGDTAKLLAEASEALTNDKWSLLHWCAAYGDVHGLSRHANSDPQLVRSKTLAGQQPLHLAAQFGQLACVEALVQVHHSPLASVDGQGRTPLQTATVAGHGSVREFLSRETGLLRTRTGTGDALATALMDPRLITAVEWYTLPLSGSPPALGGVHSLLAITVGHKRNAASTASTAAAAVSSSSSSSSSSSGMGPPGTARGFARSTSMPAVPSHSDMVASRTPSPTSAPLLPPSTAMPTMSNSKVHATNNTTSSGASWAGAHVYVIEKADGDASYMVGGVYVSHWKDVAAQVHELAKYSLRGSDLCLVPEAQTMAGLYSLALGLGPYDVGRANCHHMAKLLFNTCAVPKAKVHRMPNAFLTGLANCLQMVGVDVSCLAANVSVNSFGVANSVAVASTIPSSKPSGLKPSRFDRLLPDFLPLQPDNSNLLLPSSSAYHDSREQEISSSTADNIPAITTAKGSSSNKKKKSSRNDDHPKNSGSMPASKLDLAAPCALLSEWIYDPSPSVSVLVNLLEEDVVVKVEETGQRLHIKAGGQSPPVDFTRPNGDSTTLSAITVRVHRVVDGGLWGRLSWLDRESKHLLLCTTLAPRHTYQLTPAVSSGEAKNDDDDNGGNDNASSSTAQGDSSSSGDSSHSSTIECRPTSLAQLTPDLVVRHVELAEGGNTVQWAVVTRVSHHGCDNPIEEEDVFVVFRGTSSVADVIADVGAVPLFLPSLGLRVHGGMWAALHSDRNGTLSRILDALRASAPPTPSSYSSLSSAEVGGANDNPRTRSSQSKNTSHGKGIKKKGRSGNGGATSTIRRRLVLCGHSLGGGYALLTALELLAMAPPPPSSSRSNTAKGAKAKTASANKRSLASSPSSSSSPSSAAAAAAAAVSGVDQSALLPMSFCQTPEVVTFGAPMVLVPDGENHLWRSLASCATLVVNAWDAVPRLPSCASWVFQVLPAPAVTGIALGLGLKVGLGGLADRVEKAMRPLWPALKAYAPCGTLAFIDAEQPGKVMCLPPELPPSAIADTPPAPLPSKGRKKKAGSAASMAVAAAKSLSLASSSENGHRSSLSEATVDIAGVAQRAFLDVAPSAPGDFVATQHAISRYLTITGFLPQP